MKNNGWKRKRADILALTLALSMLSAGAAGAAQIRMSEAAAGDAQDVTAQTEPVKEAAQTEMNPADNQEDQTAQEERGLKLTLSGSVAGTQVETINALLRDSQILISSGKGNDESSLLNIEVQLMGVPIAEFLGQSDEHEISFSVPMADEHVYETSPDSLMNLIAGSITGADGEPVASPSSEQSGSSPTLSGILGKLEEQLHLDQMPQTDAQACQRVFAPYLSLIENYISQSGTLTEGTQVHLENLDTSFTGDLYYVEPTAQQSSQLLDDLADTIEDDDNLGLFVSEWITYIGELDQFITGTDPNGEALDSQGTARELQRFYDELPQALRSQAQTLLADGYTYGGFHFAIASDEENKNGLFDFGIGQAGSEELNFGLERTMNAAGLYELALYGGNQEQTGKMLGQFSWKNGLYNGRLSLSLNDMILGTLNYNFDGNRKSVLGIPTGLAALSLANSLSAQFAVNTDGPESDYVLTVEGLGSLQSSGQSDEAVNGFTIDLTAEAVSLEKLDLKSPKGTSVDISDYTQEQLSDLFTELIDKSAAVIENMFSGSESQ